MGNVSPRQSKSYHDGLNNHLSLSAATTSATTLSTTTTPNRSSWKKQLQILNETLNIKKFSFRHSHGRQKRYRTNDEIVNHHKLSTSQTTQNFHDLIKTNHDKSKKLPHDTSERQTNPFKKSFSLFSMKQPLADTTNKESSTKFTHHHTTKDKNDDEQPKKISLNSSNVKNSNQFVLTKQQTIVNQENHHSHEYKRRHKFEITSGKYSCNYN